MKVDVKFEDIQPGDLVTLSYEGHEFSGEVWRDDEGVLMVGATAIGVYDGSLRPWVFVSATREVKLPTGIGAVIETNNLTRLVRTGENMWIIEGDYHRSINSDSNVLKAVKQFKVLSEGVEID